LKDKIEKEKERDQINKWIQNEKKNQENENQIQKNKKIMELRMRLKKNIEGQILYIIKFWIEGKNWKEKSNSQKNPKQK
jgi:hypothetical protein